MPLTIVGIDEAGYGPMLGPLVVARAAFRVRDWEPNQPAPDFWKLLSGAVCRKGSDKQGRLPFDDSKKLKRANDTDQPLVHLMRTVLAVLAATRNARPRTDLELFEALGVMIEPQPWYEGDPHPLPGIDDSSAARIGIDANSLAGCMLESGVDLLDLNAIAIGERTFNHIIKREGSKAATTSMAIGQHVRHTWQQWGADAVEGGPRIVCDRQGGRADYTGPIREWLPDAEQGTLSVIEQTEARSRYRLICGEGDARKQATLLFQTDSESAYLPIALASMAAKLTRELLMARFNRYWSTRAAMAGIELKPTAGYVQDARRWLADARPLVTADERRTMVRIA